MLVADAWLANAGDGAIAVATEQRLARLAPSAAVVHAAYQGDLLADAYPELALVPPLAGLCTLERAMKPGISVEESVRRLKRYHYAFKRLHEIFVARLTAEPLYELKTAFEHHAYLCAEHVAALREGVGEMR